MHPEPFSIPYKLNGRDPAEGLDCWQFCRWWHRDRTGVHLPDLTYGAHDHQSCLLETMGDPSRLDLLRRDDLRLAPPDGAIVALAFDARQVHLGIASGRRLLTMSDKGLRVLAWNRCVAFVVGVFTVASNPACAPSAPSSSSA